MSHAFCLPATQSRPLPKQEFGIAETSCSNFALGISDAVLHIPDYIRKDHKPESSTWQRKKRKRGKRGGVRLCTRKQCLKRIPLPTMILGNVQSLRSKIDELQGNVQLQKDFRECCVLAFTETWLSKRDQDRDLWIDSFGLPIRMDRDTSTTGKTLGGGVCVYLNRRYGTSVTVRENICLPDIELLSVSIRPFYLPREFPKFRKQYCTSILRQMPPLLAMLYPRLFKNYDYSHLMLRTSY